MGKQNYIPYLAFSLWLFSLDHYRLFDPLNLVNYNGIHRQGRWVFLFILALTFNNNVVESLFAIKDLAFLLQKLEFVLNNRFILFTIFGFVILSSNVLPESFALFFFILHS
jgi:hypothetical protein